MDLQEIKSENNSEFSFWFAWYNYLKYENYGRITAKVIVLPKITAANESPTFPNTFNPNNANCLLSKRLIDSSANDDIVVKDPQNPTAKNNEYFGSKLKVVDKIEKIPTIKLPMILTSRTFTGRKPNKIGDEVILYLRNAPARAPMPSKINSIPFIFYLPTILNSKDRHYQHSYRSGLGISHG